MATTFYCKHCGLDIQQEPEKALDGTYAVVWTAPGNGWICGETGDEHEPEAFTEPDEDETWKVTYPEKPEWWDDPTEPRCDVCGVHTEEACVYVKDPNVDLERYPGAWCGECGNCADHCTCDDNPMDPVEALTYAILAINTDQAPDATSGNDLLYLELNAERALAALAEIREWVIAQGDDFINIGLGRGE